MQRKNTHAGSERVKLTTTKENHTNSKNQPKSGTFPETGVQMAKGLPGGKTTGNKVVDRNVNAGK